MKHTDTQIQNAIDYAFGACPSSRLTTFRGGLNWTTEAPFRLAIAKNLLEKLPKSNSDTELERIIAAAHEAGWNGVENSKDLAQFILDFEHSIDAKYAKHIHPDDHDRRVKIVQDMAKVEIKELRDELATPQSTHKTKLTQNGPEICSRPDCRVGVTHYERSHPDCTAKATPHKPVPDGYTLLQDGAPEFEKLPENTIFLDKKVSQAKWLASGSIHCTVDEWKLANFWYAIPTPDPYADKPMLTKPISSTPWTPAVGDVVQLKSGGPKMTILSQSLNDDDEPLSDTWFCGWIDSTGSTQTWRKINSACLTLVTK